MLGSSHHEGEALGFLSSALVNHDDVRENLVAAQVEATLAVAAALNEVAAALGRETTPASSSQ
jgi:hypothetical protein